MDTQVDRIIWAEDKRTKEVLIFAHSYPFGPEHPVWPYSFNEDIEVFLYRSHANAFYWWHIENGEWRKCNWSHSLPKIIQMHILTGAL